MNGAAIPSLTIGQIERYINQKIPPGDFVERVLQNDLLGAVYFGDEENLAALPQLVRYIHDTLSWTQWGNEERYKSWLNGSDVG